MKKLSVVLALVLCVTIGGVFANWIYAGTNATNLHHHMANIVLSDVNSETKIGTYSVVQGDDTIKIKIDQKNSTAGSLDYHTVLSVTGSMTITFTPNALYTGGAPTAKFTLASENDVSQIKFSDVAYGGQLNDVAIFSKFDKTTETPLTFTDADADGIYEATITADDIKALITVNEFLLPTETAYNAFAGVLSGIGKIGINVIDTTVIA